MDFGNLTREQLIAEVRSLRRRIEAIEGAGPGLSATKRAVSDNEEPFRLAFDNGPIGMSIGGLDGRILRANRVLCDMLGYSEEELTGRPIMEVTHPDDVERTSSLIRRVIDGEIPGYSLEKRYLRKDGRVVWVNVTVSAARDAEGTMLYGLAMIEDITQQKHAREKLREAEHRYIADHVADVIWTAEFGEAETNTQAGAGRSTTDLDGLPVPIRLSYVSPSVRTLLGYTPEEMLERPLRHFFAADSYEFLKAELARDFAAGQYEPSVLELELVTKEGAKKWCEVSSTYYRNEEDEVVGMLGVTRDVAERKRVERALQEKDRALTKEHVHLRRLLDIHERDRQVLAYELHDGFIPPLTAAAMQCEASGSGAKSGDSPDAAECCQRAVHLLRQSIDEARRLMSGLRPAALDQFGVVRAIEGFVLETDRSGETEIDLQCDVTFDRLARPLELALFRVVQEGVTNALRHSRSDRVVVRLHETGDRVCVEVRDWGKGFDLEETAQKGFGLEGVKERARLFGGSCEIESRPGGGTRLRVQLPFLKDVSLADDEGRAPSND
ncbi:MAG: PAS domain-containing sensor histidine kinase [Planctomycetota bacterium]|jgi:PAS domain S-box-containing protein